MMRPIDGDDLMETFKLLRRTRAATATPEQMSLMVRTMIRDAPTIDVAPVVFCKDCQHCRLLDDGESFSCLDSEMDYYAPHYSAVTYYCASGKRREGDVQS